MGCDIHFYLEKRENNRWVSVDKWTTEFDKELNCDYTYVKWEDRPYNGRNYTLFSILADVRNGECIEPICDPKGFPFNASPELFNQYTVKVTDDTKLERMQEWVDMGLSTWVEKGKICTSPDYHSASYLTTKEILSYNWFNTLKETFYIKLREYISFGIFYDTLDYRVYYDRQWYSPEPDEHVVSEEEVKQATCSSVFPENTVVQVERGVPYSVYCKGFWTHTIPLMCSLGDLDSVRAVFWFDN